MSEVTTSSMHDARDAEDNRLLAAGEFNVLIPSYYESIIQRCRVRCRSEDDALDCAQAVVVRLLSELKRGKRYSVPCRVVVHKVIEWTTKGFYERGRAILVELDDDLPEEVFRPGNPYADAGVHSVGGKGWLVPWPVSLTRHDVGYFPDELRIFCGSDNQHCGALRVGASPPAMATTSRFALRHRDSSLKFGDSGVST